MKTKPAAFLMLVLLLVFGMVSCAAAEAPRSVDVIMVLDCSDSMNANDKNKLMVRSAMNFVDMCDISGTRVALIPYSYQQRQTSNVLNFQDVSSLNVRAQIRRVLYGLKYGGATDSGKAFAKARAFYEDRTDARNQVIVLFFSDGKVDCDDSNGPATVASKALADSTVAFFRDENVPIYCIGLKGKGDFDQAWLDQIANATGTREARVVTVQSSASLHETFSEIFAEYLGTIPLDIPGEEDPNALERTVQVNIPNDSILEANINLSFVQPGAHSSFNAVRIQNPAGEVVAPLTSGSPQRGDVITGDSDAYFNIKLIRPQRGTWKITYNASQVGNVDAKMISNYDIGIRFVLSNEPRKNQPLTIRAEFYSLTGEAYSDQYLYVDSLIDRVIATVNGAALSGFAFTATPDALCYTASLDALTVGDYHFELFIHGDGIICTTGPLDFTVANHAPLRIGDDPAVVSLGIDGLLYRPTRDTLRLHMADYFADEDGDALTFSASRNNLSAQAFTMRMENGDMLITFREKAEGDLTLFANDGTDSSAKSLTLHFSVRSLSQQVWLEVIIGALIALALALGSLLFYNAKRSRFGRYACFETAYAGLDYKTPPVGQINLGRYDVETVSLFKVLDNVNSTGSDAVMSAKNELSGIVIKPAAHHTIKVCNNMNEGAQVSAYVDEADLPRKHSRLLTIGSTLRLNFAMDNRYITLTYQNEAETEYTEDY